MSFSFINTSKYLLAVSAVLVVASVVLFIEPGPKFSIEFTGGTLMELKLPAEATKDELHAALDDFKEKEKTELGNYSITVINDQQGRSFLVRTAPLSNEQHVALMASLTGRWKDLQELKYNTIGPSLSQSLKRNSVIALSVASAAIILYLAFAFRKMPRQLSPWKFGALAVLAFLHDVIITSGLFIVVGWFTSFEFDPLFVTALLTILAYSANDTVVIYDRIRDKFQSEGGKATHLESIVNTALRECVTRTFNTVMAALIMLASIFFLGADSIRWFVLALMTGTLVGAYSSYFIAAPLLVYWKKRS